MITLIDHRYIPANQNTQWRMALVARNLTPDSVIGIIVPPQNIHGQHAYFLHAGIHNDVRDAWIEAVRAAEDTFLILISERGPQELMQMTPEDNAQGIFTITWLPRGFATDPNAAQFVTWLRQQLNRQ